MDVEGCWGAKNARQTLRRRRSHCRWGKRGKAAPARPWQKGLAVRQGHAVPIGMRLPRERQASLQVDQRSC